MAPAICTFWTLKPPTDKSRIQHTRWPHIRTIFLKINVFPHLNRTYGSLRISPSKIMKNTLQRINLEVGLIFIKTKKIQNSFYPQIKNIPRNV